MRGHWSAFKSPAAGITAPRLLAFVALTGSPNQFRPDAAADAYFALARTARRAKRFQVEPVARFLLNLAGGPVGFFPDDFASHKLSPPLPLDAALYGSCREFPACSPVRPLDANGAGQARESFAAYHRCS